MKRILVVLLALMMLLSSIGMAAAEEAKPEKLTVLIWGIATTQDKMNGLIQTYFTDVTGIPVETILVPQSDFYEKLTTMIATNTPPDITWIPDASFPLYFNEGLLVDLSDVVADEAYNYEDFNKPQRESYQVDGVPYAIPFSAPSQVLLYNKTLVEKAGLETPNELYEKGEWTSERFYEYAIKLTDKENGVYGLDMANSSWSSWGQVLYPLFRSYGGEFWSADGSEWLMNSEENIAALEMFGDLMFKYNAHPKPGDSADFYAGQSALYPVYCSAFKKCVNLDFEWDCAPMPFAPNGMYAGNLGTASMGILTSSPNQEWAKQLLKCLTGMDIMRGLQDNFVPPRYSLINSEEYVTGYNGQIPRPTYEHYKQSVLDQAPVIKVKDVHLNVESLDDVIIENLEAFYMQAVDAATCLQMIEDGVQEFLVTK